MHWYNLIDWPTLTNSVVFWATVLLCCYDAVAWRYGGSEATLSVCVRRCCRDAPELIFVIAILAWHLIGGR